MFTENDDVDSHMDDVHGGRWTPTNSEMEKLIRQHQKLQDRFDLKDNELKSVYKALGETKSAMYELDLKVSETEEALS